MQQVLLVHKKSCLPSAYVLRYVWLRQLILPPAKKLREGDVFTPVCDSVHGGQSLCPRGSLSRGVSVQEGSLYK